MRHGGGKQKGASFERRICKMLSLWVSNRKKQDLFWRSAMSGGRATLGLAKGQYHSRQAGDICAVAPEGHYLTNHFYVELKHLKRLCLDQFFLLGKGPLARFWEIAQEQASDHGKNPMMIVKQNHLPELVITEEFELREITVYDRLKMNRVVSHQLGCEVHLLTQVLKTKFKGPE